MISDIKNHFDFNKDGNVDHKDLMTAKGLILFISVVVIMWFTSRKKARKAFGAGARRARSYARRSYRYARRGYNRYRTRRTRRTYGKRR